MSLIVSTFLSRSMDEIGESEREVWQMDGGGGVWTI